MRRTHGTRWRWSRPAAGSARSPALLNVVLTLAAGLAAAALGWLLAGLV